jgi:uncharacterized phage protein (TIGR02220 family)
VSRYRKIDPRIWNDEKFRTLSNDGKLVFLFLLSHPHMTALGAMRASIAGLASELQWPTKAFGEAFREALSKGMCKHDSEASFIWLPKFLKYNGPESPNVVKSWSQSADLLPECEMKNELLQAVKAFVEALPEAFRKALPEAFAKSMPYQEREQEQEYNSGAKAPVSISSTSKKRRIVRAARIVPSELQPAVQKIIGRLNELAGAHFDAHSKIVLDGLVPRLQQDATESDCIAVVEDRYREWKDKPEMLREYFNPETLFRESKFEKYKNIARMNSHQSRKEPKFVNA